jgi:hypothetical protein
MYQFALLAVLVVAALWFFVLRDKVSSSSSETQAPAVHAPTNVHRAVPPAAAAPGAHHAAGASTPAQRAARAHAGVAATHPGVAPTHPAAAQRAHQQASPAHAPAASATHTAAPATHHAVVTTHAPAAPAATKGAGATSSTTPVVKSIEGQLAANKIVLVLFWDPRASTDQFVQRELASAARMFGGGVAVYRALANQVTDFGTFTQKALVTETPTILMITPSKQETAYAGYNTSSAIAQSVEEAGGKRSAAPPPSHAPKPKQPAHATGHAG